MLKVNDPLAPDTGTSALNTLTAPDPELALDPLLTVTLPPTVATRDAPALNTIAPPTPLSLLPTTTLTDPP